jgi:hypothetical protein
VQPTRLSRWEQAKTFESELEIVACRKPLGALPERSPLDTDRNGRAKLMLFKILKLFGLEVRAEISAVKGQIEQRVDDMADRARHAALSAAVIIVLSTFAGLFCTMAIGVGVLALYRTEAEAYGVDVSLAVIAAVLVAVALILLIVALMMGKSLSTGRAAKVVAEVARAAAAPAATPAPVPSPAAFAGDRADSAGDLIEPLALLLAKHVNFPALGHPLLDELVGNLRASARGTVHEAVERAANLVRYGDRSQLLILLGGAAVVGWLLARQSPDNDLRDITPAG